MPAGNFHVFLVICVYFARADFIEKNSDNYGPYTLEMNQFFPCRGPKLANLTVYTTSLVKESISYMGSINITFLDDTRIEDVKMTVYTMKGDRKVPLWNYIINKPCQHYAMSKVFETYVGSQNCVVKKGTYTCTLNMTEITKSYLGESFFYGEFIFKVTVVSKKGNISCFIFNPHFRKKV